jgi:hypothetical protein
MANLELNDALKQVEAKMAAELKDNHPYEALQYVQSFVARKKKGLGQANTSAVVFHGARQFAASDASSSAGTLLQWFIEDGAGLEYQFALDASNYCDVQRVIDLLTPLSSAQAFPIVDLIYDPLHLYVAKSKAKKSAALIARLNQFEELSAKINVESGAFFRAFKSYLRLNKMNEAASTLNEWSKKGYASEKPLFFARAILYLLSENKTSAASELLEISKAHVEDNSGTEGVSAGNGGGPESCPLAVWHLATILTELAAMPPLPRVDKTKLFGLLYGRYGPFLVQYDTKLLEFLTKAGEHVFGFSLQAQQPNRATAPAATPSNPMAMLQGLLAGGAGGPGGNGAAPGKGGMDMGQMMSMMNKMKGAK